jgi:hypothetical protein
MYTCASGDAVSNPNLCPGGANAATPQGQSSTFGLPSPTAQAVCGDNICQESESCMGCAQDCYCSDNQVCSPTRAGSTAKGCYSAFCGDEFCDSTLETKDNCCTDCGCSTGAACQNNVCVGLVPTIDLKFNQNFLINGQAYSALSATALVSKNNQIKLGEVVISNAGNDTANSVHVTVESPQGYFEKKEFDYSSLPKGQSQNFDLTLNFTTKILELVDKTDLQINMKASYANSINKSFEQSASSLLTVYGRNSVLCEYPTCYSAWVSPKQPAIREFAAKATSGLAAGCAGCGTLEDQYLAAYWLFESMKSYGIAYVNDIQNVGDYVQLPYETFKNKNGDCEDLAITYASLLEAIGMESVLIKVPGHVFSGFIDKDNKLVPIETTADDYMSAASMGAQEYTSYANAGTLQLVRVRDAWQQYPAVVMPNEPSMPMPNISKQVGPCGIAFNLPNLWVASANITFTNNGAAPSAGCAVVITYQNQQVKDAKYGCWTIQPGATQTVTLQPDIDIFSGYSCIVK